MIFVLVIAMCFHLPRARLPRGTNGVNLIAIRVIVGAIRDLKGLEGDAPRRRKECIPDLGSDSAHLRRL